jgi:hypothetical protein
MLLVSRDAAAARGRFIQLSRNLLMLKETRAAAFDVPCPDTGVDFLQIIIGVSMLRIE